MRHSFLFIIGSIVLTLNAFADTHIKYEGHKDSSLKIEWTFIYEASSTSKSCTKRKGWGAGMGLPSYSSVRIPKKKELTIVTESGSTKFSFEIERQLQGACKYTHTSTYFYIVSAVEGQRASSILWAHDAQIGPKGTADFECTQNRNFACYPVRYTKDYSDSNNTVSKFDFSILSENFPEPEIPADALDIGGKYGTFEIVSPILQDYRNKNGGQLPAVLVGQRIIGERLDGKLNCHQTLAKDPSAFSERNVTVSTCTLLVNGQELKLRYSLDELVNIMMKEKPGQAPWSSEAEFHYHSRGKPKAYISNIK